MTYIFQNVSFLNPRAYAILHRLHHAYSDTEKDPHSPRNYRNLFMMMRATAIRYHEILMNHVPIPKQFLGGYPEWRGFDKFAESWPSRVLWMILFTTFYFFFAPAWWCFIFLPLHFLMGPVHGAIVNWFGHALGYRNYDSNDDSRNTLVFDFLMLGELFQNNHHQHPKRPNFGVKWYEFDPVYHVMKPMAWVGIIRYPEKKSVVAGKPNKSSVGSAENSTASKSAVKEQVAETPVLESEGTENPW